MDYTMLSLTLSHPQLSSRLTADIGAITQPQPGLVPFHPDFKGLTIDNDGVCI